MLLCCTIWWQPREDPLTMEPNKFDDLIKRATDARLTRLDTLLRP